MSKHVDENGVPLPPVPGTGDFIEQWTSYARTQNDPVGTWANVSPLVAMVMKEHDANNYRPLNDGKAAQYAHDMVSGQWRPTVQPISFDTKGNLDNGQHRVEAILDSGKTIRFHLMFGQAQSAREATDIGKPRNIVDIYNISESQAAVARNFHVLGGEQGFGGRYPTKADIFHTYQKYAEGIDFSIEQLPKKSGSSDRPRGICRTPTRVVIARAYLAGVPKAKLESLCAILRDGSGGDSGLNQMVRNFRDSLINRFTGNGNEMNKTIYHNFQTLVRAYCDDVVRKKIEPTGGHIFLPKSK